LGKACNDDEEDDNTVSVLILSVIVVKGRRNDIVVVVVLRKHELLRPVMGVMDDIIICSESVRTTVIVTLCIL